MGFASETEHKARKPHRCDGCGHLVEIGTTYVRWAGTTDGDFSQVSFHKECREAEIALNKLSGTDWDEWMGLCDMETDDWPWLISDFPTIAARMNITQDRYDERMAERKRCAEIWRLQSSTPDALKGDAK
jgi:hypothetical protein